MVGEGVSEISGGWTRKPRHVCWVPRSVHRLVPRVEQTEAVGNVGDFAGFALDEEPPVLLVGIVEAAAGGDLHDVGQPGDGVPLELEYVK